MVFKNVWKKFCIIFFVGIINAQDKTEVNEFLYILSKAYNVPIKIPPAIVQVESSYNQKSISKKNAYGIMQITSGAFSDYLFANPNSRISNFQQIIDSWKDNCRVGVWYLKFKCFRNHKELSNAITAYYYGPWSTNFKYNYYNRVKKEMK